MCLSSTDWEQAILFTSSDRCVTALTHQPNTIRYKFVSQIVNSS
jgi:hypothetical protein